MQISIQVDRRKLREVTRLLSGIKQGVPKALSGAVNDTARKTVTDLSSKIRQRVNIKKRDIDPHLRRSRATPAHPSAKISVSESTRLPLKYFGARQVRKGVTYKIEKGGSRKLIPSAFIVQSMGGHVFARVGPKRFPLRKPMAVSPWGVVVKSNIPQQTEREAAALLEKNLDQRVKFLLLKQSGAI